MEVQAICQRLREVEVPTGAPRSAVDNLRQDLASVVAHVEPDAARQNGVRDAFGFLRQRLAARRTAVPWGRPVGGRSRGVVTVLRTGDRHGARYLRPTVPSSPGDGESGDRSDERDAGEPERALQESRPHKRDVRY